MKVVSIDIETTGIHPDSDQIVEFGAVLFDTAAPTFAPIVFHKSIVNEHITGSPFAINMNISKIMFAKDLMDKLVKVKKDTTVDNYRFITMAEKCLSNNEPNEFVEDFCFWLKSHEAYSGRSINIAGKNAAGFDVPFCLNFFPGWGDCVRWKRRILDPAILYSLRDDEKLPDLSECLARAGFEPAVSHCAVDDAIDVAMLIYKHYNPQVDIFDIHKAGEDAKVAHHTNIEFLKTYDI